MRKVTVRSAGVVLSVGALLCSALSVISSTAGAAGASVQVISGSQYGFNQPDGISSDGTDVWVTNPGNNSVTEFSASTGALVQVISGSQYDFSDPTAILSDGTHVWVTNYDGNSVTELSASTGALVQVLNATLANSQPEFYAPDGLAESGGSVWVSNWGPTVVGASAEGMITELSASTGALVQVVDNPNSSYGAESGIAADANDIWVTNTDGGSVSEFSTSNGASVQYMNGAAYEFASPEAITTDGTDVWVVNGGGNGETTEFSASTGALVQLLDAVNGANIAAMSADGTDLWVVGSAAVTELVETTGAVVATLTGVPYDFQGSERISINQGTAWVTNAANNTVTEFPTVAAALLTPTTPTISNLPTNAQVGGSFSAAVTTNGDGTAAVRSNSTSVCTVNFLLVTFSSAGTCSLTASVGAGTTYAAATGVAQTFTVAAASQTPDPIVGNWNVTYGAAAVVTMTLASGVYTETAETPVEVTGSSCDLPVGTVIATFSSTGARTYSGTHGLWNTSNCAYVESTSLTLTLSADGNTLSGELGDGEQVSFTKVPTLIAQSALTITTLSGTLGTSLNLATSGGSGTGAVTFIAADGTASGCVVSGGALTASTAGTCVVTATKKADTSYLGASSSPTTITLKAKTSASKPATVTVTFSARGTTLSASGKRSLAALARKLEPGAWVTCTGYARSNAGRAASRARAVSLYLAGRVSIHITLKKVTTLALNKVTVTTTKQ